MTLENIIKEINKAKNIAILTHENPDGDAIRKQFSIVQCIKNFKQRCRCNNTRIF